MFRKKLFSQVGYQVSGRIVIAAIGVFVTAMLSRYLGVNDFGTFNFLLTIAYFAYLAADYGLQTLLVRDIASHTPIHNDVSDFLGLRILLATLITGVLVVLSAFLPYTIVVKMALLIIALGEFGLILMGVLWGIFQGKVAFGRLVLIQIAMSVIQAVLMIGGVYFKAPLLYFACVHFIVVMCGLALSWKGAKTFLNAPVAPRFNVAQMKTLLRRGYPFAIGLFVSVAYFKMDTLILGYYFDPQIFPDVGLYSLAYKPFEVVTVIGGYVSSTLYPLFVPLVASQQIRKEFREYLSYSLLLAAGAGMFLYMGAPFLIMLLGGPEYTLASMPLQILGVAAAVTILSGYFVAIALAGGKEKQLMQYGVVALVANILLNVLWVPIGSYIATSWTTVITQTIIMIGNAYAAWQVVRIQKSI